jgi:hypothetical protein
MIAADIARIATLGVPVLCLDTCSILDIMRDPTRESVQAHERAAALQLLSALETGRLICLVADQVLLEFDEYSAEILQEAENGLKKFLGNVARVHAVVAAFGGSGSIELSHFTAHSSRSKAVVDRIIAAAQRAPQRPEIASRALLRVNQARTPARKGKESMKDCVVIETYLDTVTALRAAGLRSKIVFASSNTKEYVGPLGGPLKADIAEEFANLGIEYAPNLAAAKHSLGL